MDTLLLNSFGQTHLLEPLWSMHHGTHHDLRRHTEATRVHLAQNYRLLLAWLNFNLVGCPLEWFLQLQLLELGVID